MAPFRGRGRGGRGRGGRGGHAAGGGGGGGRLARSGIKTKSGYRKFDSQRVKEIESDSEGGGPEGDIGEGDEEVVEQSSDEEEIVPAVKGYNALLASFLKQAEDTDGRRLKRRKIETEEESTRQDVSDEAEEKTNASSDLEEKGDQRDSDGADEDMMDREDEVGEDDEVDHTDPFESHFANPDDNELSRRLQSIQANQWKTEKQPVKGVGLCTVCAPACVEHSAVAKPFKSIDGFWLKQRLQNPAHKVLADLDAEQRALAPYMVNYQDVLMAGRTPQNASNFRNLASLHAVNHVLKGRDKVLKNNDRLTHATEELDLRDQGFTRPKVLILLETRQMCAKYAQSIISFFDPIQQDNKQRFDSAFDAPGSPHSTMPEDFRELFDGNNDNNFLTAIKFTRKTLRFFSAFYNSDIIIASPLGLRRIIENEDLKKRDYDFLSSIEISIVDQADAMQMQSWENVEIVFNHLNAPLREAHDADFSRVRNYYLDGHARHLRQTLISTAYITPEMNRLFSSTMLNTAGKAKMAPSYPGAIASVAGQGIKQTFTRFDAASPLSDPDARFKYFTTAVLPSLLRLPKPPDGAPGILLFIPSYFDFLRLRNFFATSALTQDVSFGAVHDYSETSEQRRARSHFLSGRHAFLLYTQRAHHFFRLRIKGVKRVVMYGLPDNERFYEELVGGFLGTSLEEGRAGQGECVARCVFSKWDGLRLERVVGSERAKGLWGGKGDTFDFV